MTVKHGLSFPSFSTPQKCPISSFTADFCVGKGPSVNIEALGELPIKTIKGHVIPKDYNCHIYTVGDPAAFLVKIF